MEGLRAKAEKVCEEKLITREGLATLLNQLKNDLNRVDAKPETSWSGAAIDGFWDRGNQSFRHSDRQVIWGRTYSSGSSDPFDKPKRLFLRLLGRLHDALVIGMAPPLERAKQLVDDFKREYPKLDIDMFLEHIRFFELLREVLFSEYTAIKSDIAVCIRAIRKSSYDEDYFEDLINTVGE